MNYRDEFQKLVDDNKLEDARLLLEKYKYHALDDAFYYSNMGWLCNHMENFQEAELFLRKGILYFPDDGWLHAQLGYSLDHQNLIKEGLECHLKALDLGYDEPWLQAEIGWCHKQLNEHGKAIQYFENALLEDDRNVWVLSQAAGSYFEMGDHETALEYYKKSYQILPDDDGLLDLIQVYRNLEMYEDEIHCLLLLKDENLKDYKEYELGLAYYYLGSYEEALPHLLHVLEQGRDETRIHCVLGDVYLNLQDKSKSDLHFNKALSYYEKALEREMDQYWIYQEMIWIVNKQNNHVKKLEYLDQLTKLIEPDAWTYYHYATSYSELGNYEECLKACEEFFKFEDDNVDILDIYAWSLCKSNQYKKSIDILNQRIERYGGSDWVFGELGWNYAYLKDYKKSFDYFDKAAKETPTSLYYAMAGWCTLYTNQLDLTEEYLTKALSLDPNDGWIYSLFGDLYELRKEYELALESYHKAILHGFNEQWVLDAVNRLEKEI